MRPLEVRHLGVISYEQGLALQADLVQQRRAGAVPDTLLLLQHPHVLTIGVKKDGRANVLASQGGTFTITNPGNFGAQFGLPVINQPQVAILGVGTIEKRPVVIDDMIGIRTMGYLTLGYDHRLVDGAVADQFMADLKKTIENFDGNQL